jgi:arylsulfatase A-like enzyme
MRSLVGKSIKRIPVLFLCVGALAVIFSLAADRLGVGGEAGFGSKQILVLVLGLIFVLAGAILRISGVRRYLGEWHAPGGMIGSPGSILLIAAWFGLFTAFGELVILGVRKFLQSMIVQRGLFVIWTLPLTEVVLFGSLGLILFLLSKKIGRLAETGKPVFVFSFLAYLSILLMFPGIQILADIVLALGLALQTARLAASHPHRFYLLIYHTVGWMRFPEAMVTRKPLLEQRAQGQTESTISRRDFLVTMGVTLGGLAVGVSGFEKLVERNKLASLRIAPKRSPNVLLLVLDTVRAQSLSLYGYQKPTSPQLERIAQNAVVFENARATAPWTLPSHASMFTGHYPHELSCGWTEPLDATYPTLAELLADAGYETAGFIANLAYCEREYGLNRGFIHYEDYKASIGQMIGDPALGGTIARELLPSMGDYQLLGRKSAASINHDFLSWLDRRGNSHPFFAFLNYFDAHSPYIPPKDFAQKFMSMPLPGYLPLYNMDSITPVEAHGFNQAYDACIAYIDHQVGLLYDELARKGVLDDTLVIITADHGEQFGEHGLFSHGNSLYRPLLYVPLMLLLPGQVPQRIKLSNEASLHEIPATVVDLLGINANYQFPGKSLSRFWSNGNDKIPNRTPLFSEVKKAPSWLQNKGTLKALIFQEVKYIKNEGTGEEELYDLRSDPGEQTNLAGSQGDQKTIQWFRSSLKEALQVKSGV